MGNTVGSRDKTKLNLSVTECAFIAGFLEGDGCISAKITPTSGSYRVMIVISFTQRQEGRIVLEYLANLLHEPIADYSTRNMSELVVRERKKLISLIESIQPFLVSKQQQARYALKIIEILNRSKRGALRSPKNLLETVNLAEKIRALNSGRKDKVVHTFSTVYNRLKEKGLVF